MTPGGHCFLYVLLRTPVWTRWAHLFQTGVRRRKYKLSSTRWAELIFPPPHPSLKERGGNISSAQLVGKEEVRGTIGFQIFFRTCCGRKFWCKLSPKTWKPTCPTKTEHQFVPRTSSLLRWAEFMIPPPHPSLKEMSPRGSFLTTEFSNVQAPF